MVTFSFLWSQSLSKETPETWITDVLGLLVSAFCVPRVPTDSLALFLFIAEWNISAIYEVKYFRALSVCWSVLPVYFLKGTNLHKTRGTGEWQ